MDKLSRLRQISIPDWFLLLEASVLLPLAALGLRAIGFGRCRSVVSRMCWLGQPALGRLGDARHVSNVVSTAARHLWYGPNCLERALVLSCILRQFGVESDIQFGVRLGSGQFEAHAWVECSGVVLNDDADVGERYSTFDYVKRDYVKRDHVKGDRVDGLEKGLIEMGLG